LKGKRIAGRSRWESRRGHGREYHNWIALVKGKLEKFSEEEQSQCACLLERFASITGQPRGPTTSVVWQGGMVIRVLPCGICQNESDSMGVCDMRIIRKCPSCRDDLPFLLHAQEGHVFSPENALISLPLVIISTGTLPFTICLRQQGFTPHDLKANGNFD